MDLDSPAGGDPMGLSWSGRIEFADSGSAEIQPFIEHPRLRRMGQLKGLDQKPETVCSTLTVVIAFLPGVVLWLPDLLGY